MKSLTVQELGISNQTHLCKSCVECHPSCEPKSIIFGDGTGNDNICGCDIYSPIEVRKTKDQEIYESPMLNP